jgi:cation diffusion facilitator family transporter
MTSQANLSAQDLRIRMWAAAATFFIGVAILVAKFWAFNLTKSQAIYSDALESIVNVVTALVGIIVVYYSSRPADEDHPYGHGKAEYFSSAFEGGLIFFAAIAVIFEAVKAQLHGNVLGSLDEGLWIIAGCGVANLFFGLALKQIGNKYNSPALQGSGVHLMIDFWTTFYAVIGVALVKFTHIEWIDRAVAVFLGLQMIYSGLKLVRKSALELMDAEDIKLLEQLAGIFEKNAGDGIIQIHHTKIIRAGWFHHIDGHAVVPEFWSVDQAHARLDEFESRVIQEYTFSGEVNFHLDPCRRKYCSVCDYEPCPVRIEAFKKRLPVVLEHLRSPEEPI